MYHINYEGKIYPCRARIRKCPYGDNMHAKTKEELYYKIMQIDRDVKPAPNAVNEIATTGRLRSLYSMSSIIESVEYPMEIIISSLDYAIESIEERNIEDLKNEWNDFINRSSELVYETISYGLPVPDYVPDEIHIQARKLFKERLNNKSKSYSPASRLSKGLKTAQPIRDLKSEFERFEEHKKWRLTEENKEGTLRWIKEDFYQFSHDLNTSKMLTQPIFYGNLEEAKDKIKKLDDYELMSAYDDHLLTSTDVMNNVELANNFNYKFRRDLTENANIKVKAWYDRNKKILEGWVKNTPKRVMLSIEMANELDRRGINRQENPTGR